MTNLNSISSKVMREERNLYFSIIIPAHNEKFVIEQTLLELSKLEYPKENYEIIVVENGSTDGTDSILKRLKKEGFIHKLLQSEKGVSRARNKGKTHTDKRTDWILFLDADTFLGTEFLRELSDFLSYQKENKVIGFTPLQAKNGSLYDQAWFWFIDFWKPITQTGGSLIIVKNSIAEKISFREELQLAEDFDYVLQAKKLGKYFYFRSRNVITSTRRFKKEGYAKVVFFNWAFLGIMPKFLRKKIEYKVIR